MHIQEEALIIQGRIFLATQQLNIYKSRKNCQLKIYVFLVGMSSVSWEFFSPQKSEVILHHSHY